MEDGVQWKIIWKKSEVMRISRQPSPVQVMTGQKQPENVLYFKYLQMVQKVHVKVNP
jgi:hypothetical protein